MFVGSIPNHKPGEEQKLDSSHKPLFEAARELGYHAASEGFRIIIGSSSPRTIDYYITQGAIEFCVKNPSEIAHIEIHRPENEATSFSETPDNLHFLNFSHYADPSSPHKWIVSHARAIDHSDVVVTLGGATSTRLVGHLAADRDKALVAISAFGGASEELYQTMKYVYQGFGIGASDIRTFLTSWQNASANKIINFCKQLYLRNLTVAPHSYFISYSWKDCHIADHVETLLRREKRPVLRDETDLQAGGRISNKLQALIEDCDTFIILWSNNSKESSWCPQELEYAQNLNISKGKPERVVMLVLDDSTIPLRQIDNLSDSGNNRTERELAVFKLVKNENPTS